MNTEWTDTEGTDSRCTDTEGTSGGKPPPQDLPEISDETLAAVRALQGGEVDESTRHLFETFEPKLRSYFRRHDCLEEEADDLTQTVFLQMLEQIGTLKDATRFHFWLFRIAGNYLRNSVRDNMRSREGIEDLAEKARGDSEPGAFWMRGTFEPNPEAKLVMSERVDQRRLTLRRLLQRPLGGRGGLQQVTKLAPRTLQSLVRRLHGESYEEIAHGLGVPVVTVRSHICRASTTLLRNLDKIDLALEEGLPREDDDIVADLSSEVLTFKGEALEADPAYFTAGILEAASAEYEEAEEGDEALMFPEEAEENDEDEIGTIQRVVDSPAEIAAVVREDQARGRSRRRVTRTILPAERPEDVLSLAPLSKDDLGYPLILLGEAVASLGGSGWDRDLALKARLTCAGALLARGRRFRIARQVEEIVRQAIGLIGDDKALHRVVEGRNLLRSYLGPDQKTTHHNSRRHEPCRKTGHSARPTQPTGRAQQKESTLPSRRRYTSAR